MASLLVMANICNCLCLYFYNLLAYCLFNLYKLFKLTVLFPTLILELIIIFLCRRPIDYSCRPNVDLPKLIIDGTKTPYIPGHYRQTATFHIARHNTTQFSTIRIVENNSNYGWFLKSAILRFI